MELQIVIEPSNVLTVPQYSETGSYAPCRGRAHYFYIAGRMGVKMRDLEWRENWSVAELNGRLVLFSGFSRGNANVQETSMSSDSSYSATCKNPVDLWMFDSVGDSGEWRMVLNETSSGISGRRGHSMVTITEDARSLYGITNDNDNRDIERSNIGCSNTGDNRSIFIFGGAMTSGLFMNDMYRLRYPVAQNQINAFTEIKILNPLTMSEEKGIERRCGHAMTVTSEKRIIVCGGLGEHCAGLDDIWEFDIMGKQAFARLLKPKGASPGARKYHMCAAWGEWLFVFGGIISANDNTKAQKHLIWRMKLPNVSRDAPERTSASSEENVSPASVECEASFVAAIGESPRIRCGSTGVVVENRWLVIGSTSLPQQQGVEIFEFCFLSNTWTRIVAYGMDLRFTLVIPHAIVIHHPDSVLNNQRSSRDPLHSANADATEVQYAHPSAPASEGNNVGEASECSEVRQTDDVHRESVDCNDTRSVISHPVATVYIVCGIGEKTGPHIITLRCHKLPPQPAEDAFTLLRQLVDEHKLYRIESRNLRNDVAKLKDQLEELKRHNQNINDDLAEYRKLMVHPVVGSVVRNLIRDLANQEDRKCIICKSCDIQAAFNPCGHMCCCQDCASTILLQEDPKCPMCRHGATTTLRVHMS